MMFEVTSISTFYVDPVVLCLYCFRGSSSIWCIGRIRISCILHNVFVASKVWYLKAYSCLQIIHESASVFDQHLTLPWRSQSTDRRIKQIWKPTDLTDLKTCFGDSPEVAITLCKSFGTRITHAFHPQRWTFILRILLCQISLINNVTWIMVCWCFDPFSKPIAPSGSVLRAQFYSHFLSGTSIKLARVILPWKPYWQ